MKIIKKRNYSDRNYKYQDHFGIYHYNFNLYNFAQRLFYFILKIRGIYLIKSNLSLALDLKHYKSMNK